MYTKLKFVIPLLVSLVVILAACDTGMKYVAPEIDPPADLIPGYMPEGYDLISGFQLSTHNTLPEFTGGDENGMPGLDHFLDVKSPMGNVIQGIYYQGKQNLILVTKAYFPGGTLDDWLAAYEESLPEPCDCGGLLRLDAFPLPSRFDELQEERTIDGTRVAILKGPLGWTTVFVRGDYLLTVESQIPLEENLKIVTSLVK
jgi:hypothetical protein